MIRILGIDYNPAHEPGRVRCIEHVVTRPFERLPQQPPNRLLVVDHEDSQAPRPCC